MIEIDYTKILETAATELGGTVDMASQQVPEGYTAYCKAWDASMCGDIDVLSQQVTNHWKQVMEQKNATHCIVNTQFMEMSRTIGQSDSILVTTLLIKSA